MFCQLLFDETFQAGHSGAILELLHQGYNCRVFIDNESIVLLSMPCRCTVSITVLMIIS